MHCVYGVIVPIPVHADPVYCICDVTWGAEGGPNMGAMRWAQTGNYGVLPNVVMPNTFLAQAYDLNDPWGDKTCVTPVYRHPSL